MRDLSRAREASVRCLRRARQQLLGFLLRHDRIFTGRSHWSRAHRRWLAEVSFEHPAQQIVLEELRQAIEEAEARRDRLAQEMENLLPAWSLASVVHAIQAMRGIAVISAITLVAEIGDFRRFATPQQLMAYLGLVPCERSSGPQGKEQERCHRRYRPRNGGLHMGHRHSARRCPAKRLRCR